MKKSILLLSIALVSFTSFSFAGDAPAISKNIMISFQKQFTGATNIKWENRENFIKAEFSIHDMVLYAYFNKTGDLIAVTRFISPNQLPLELMNSLKNDHADYWISDLFEVQTDNGSSYYATLQNADQLVVLKSEGLGGWNIFKREKKEHAE